MFDLGYDYNRRLKTILQEHGISIPFPTQTVKYIRDGGAEAPADKT
jgi:small-conductance mechanosensitive channel